MSLLNADIEYLQSGVGEDTWELYQAIEDSFSVNLGDYQDLLGKTVSELAGEIIARSPSTVGDRCLTSVVFYKLRRSLQVLTGSPRKDIRPSTRTSDLLPWKSRDRTWSQLQDELGLTLPGLAFSGWLLALGLLVPAILLVTVQSLLLPAWTYGLAFGVWTLLSALTLRSLGRFARDMPPICEDIGGLTRALLARNYATFAKSHGPSSKKELLSSLRHLIATHMMMPAEEIPNDLVIPSGLNIY